MADARRPTTIRKSELVNAALEIIASRGIRALTTRSLAESVGLSSGAIFKHFATLDALLLAVVEHVAEVLSATFPDPELDPLSRLERFIERRSQAVGTQVGILRLMQSEQFLLALPDGGSERIVQSQDETRRFLVKCLEEGQANGQIRADLPVPALMMIVMGTVQMLARSRSLDAHPSDYQNVPWTLLALLVPGGGSIAKTPTRTRPRRTSR